MRFVKEAPYKMKYVKNSLNPVSYMPSLLPHVLTVNGKDCDYEKIDFYLRTELLISGTFK